jgi:hypothetical protein
MTGIRGWTPSMGLVVRYWWRSGTSGTVTPAIRPISGAHMPAAFTTTSVRMAPPVVWTSWTRPSLSAMPVTRTPVRIAAPRRRAPSASAAARPPGSMWPSVGR